MVVLITASCISVANHLNSYGHWQCNLPQNKSLYEIASSYIQLRFEIIGNFSWITEKRKFISCFQRGLINVPKGLDGQVKLLNLRRNSITHIRSNDFSEYKFLEAILLQENCFSTNIYRVNVPSCYQSFIEIESDAFASLSNLIHLDLSNNKIIKVPKNLPSSLKVLGIDTAAMDQLKTADTKTLTNLQVALFGRNCIQNNSMSTNLCKRGFSIDKFNLSSDNLLYLDLPYNNLHVVPKWLFVPTLLGINLQGNPIHLVRSDDFKSCPHVKHLILSWTSKLDVTRMMIMNGAFDTLSHLTYIDLTGNMLSSIPDFTSHKNLSSIGLDFNCLKLSTNNPTNISSLSLTILEMFGNTFCDK